MQAVLAGRRPSAMLTAAAFGNAIRMLHAIGGSTNAIIHLAAMAGRVGVPLPLDELGRLGAGVPVLADVEPSGAGLLPDLDRAGGVPALLRELGGLVDPAAATVTGASIGQIAAAAPGIRRDPVAGTGVRRNGLFRRGPRVAGAGRCGAEDLGRHPGTAPAPRAGPGLPRLRGDAPPGRGPGAAVTPDTVLVLAGCGPVGVPGMPEWGMIPIPAKLAAEGVTDMVRVTDARMSGTSFGTVFLHAAPEAAVGGPLALVPTATRSRWTSRPAASTWPCPKPNWPGARARLVAAALTAPARLARALPRPRAAGTGGLRPGLPAGPDGGAPPVRRARRREVLS